MIKIIKNNCDVTDCKYLAMSKYCKAEMSFMGTKENECKNFPVCYYKQLEINKKYVEYTIVWRQEVANLKAENEKLLNEVKKLKERRD